MQMEKIILITGATDGIGLETAKLLASKGQRLLLHGRNAKKLNEVQKVISGISGAVKPEVFQADLSNLAEVSALADSVCAKHAKLDILINNAGVHGPGLVTADGVDIRFAVNTVAPYLLTKRLLQLFDASGRIVNLSSAAQAPVSPDVLAEGRCLPDNVAYAQSKLALTMWSRSLALSLGDGGPVVVAVNPGSLLGSKMVKEAYGMDGKDIGIGADILSRAALADEFSDATGKYFDNDSGRFASPHPDALNQEKCDAIVRAIEGVIAEAA